MFRLSNLRSKRLSLFGVAAWATMLALATTPVQAKTTLKKVCGGEGQAMSAGVGQHQLLCKTAYINANSGIINDNNSRVYSSVAVVCAYSCIGGLSTCGNGEGARTTSCATAQQTGTKSVDASDQSDSDLEAASANGYNAGLLKSRATELQGVSRITLGQGQGQANNPPVAQSGMPDVCRKAAQTGNVQSRIDCAVSTDSSLPEFVKTPQFQADFQKITGQPLQAVINLDGETILEKYAPSALQNAYQSMSGKISLSEFTSRAGRLAGSLIGGFPEEKRSEIASAIIPRGMQNLIPSIPGNVSGGGTALASSRSAIQLGTSANSPESPASSERQENGSEEPVRDLASASGGGTLLASLTAEEQKEYGASPENNPMISLFERVSFRYKSVNVRLRAGASP